MARSRIWNIRLSEEEREAFDLGGRLAGTTTTDFVRDTVTFRVAELLQADRPLLGERGRPPDGPVHISQVLVDAVRTLDLEPMDKESRKALREVWKRIVEHRDRSAP